MLCTYHTLFNARQDVCYLISVAGTLFGTMSAVFYMLAGNEADTDAKTMVLLKYMGPTNIAVPFYFFSIGIVSWALGGYLQVVTTARTAVGFWIKMFSLGGLILWLLFLAFPSMIQGVFAGKKEELENPPILLDEAEIESRITRFFSKLKDKHADMSLEECLRSLKKVTSRGYRVPLHILTKVKAVDLYYKKLAELANIDEDKIKDYAEVDN